MISKKNAKLFGINVSNKSSELVLEQIKKGLVAHKDFVHVVSLNPENLIISLKDPLFRQIIGEARITINDGVGIVLASRILNGTFVPRMTGVDLMQKIIKTAIEGSLRVLLIGGKPKLAEELADCYNRAYPASRFVGMVGFRDIKAPSPNEEKNILSIVAAVRPHLILVAFGSPEQEKWIYANRASLQGITCIGVGGAFDFLGGKVKRAPVFIRRIGLEWLYRLISQPWRWRRQLRLLEFIWLILKEKLSKNLKSEV